MGDKEINIKLARPFSSLTTKQHKTALIWSVVFTLITIIAMQTLSAPLITDAAPAGIISFELAGDLQTTNKIISSWSENTKIYAGLGLGLDFLFLILYCSTLILACSMVSSSLAIRKSLYFIAGTAIIWGLYTAAICDGIENIALIKLLLGSQSELLPKIAYVFASIKFVLIAFALAFIILGSIQNLMLKGKD